MKPFLMEHSQTSTEFLVLAGFIALLFLGVLTLGRSHLRGLQRENDRSLLIETAEFLDNEVGIAVKAEPGYSREFELPGRLGKANYEVLVLEEPEADFTQIVLRFVNYSIDFEQTIFASPAVEGHITINQSAPLTTVTIKKGTSRITINST